MAIQFAIRGDQKRVGTLVSSIHQFYETATEKNRKLNTHKILLYKYIKWPDRYPISASDKIVIPAQLPNDLRKQTDAFKIALKSLRAIKAFIAGKNASGDDPQIYIRYIQLLESMIHETERDVERLIPFFEAESDIINSKDFKNFVNSDLTDPLQRKNYEKITNTFINLFDQERGVYKSFTAVIVSRYHEYQLIDMELHNYLKSFQYVKRENQDNKEERWAKKGILVGLLGGIALSAIFFFVNGSPEFMTPSGLVFTPTSLSFYLGSIGAMAGTVFGGPLALIDTYLEKSARDALAVNKAFD